jgi:hypothetical protein
MIPPKLRDNFPAEESSGLDSGNPHIFGSLGGLLQFRGESVDHFDNDGCLRSHSLSFGSGRHFAVSADN